VLVFLLWNHRLASARGGQEVIAALYVATGGCYFGLPDVDPWGEERDARLYAGPWPIVAHPPCERWGRYWHGGPSVAVRKKKGDDSGCFLAALTALRLWGGVLEHPEASAAWLEHGLMAPPRFGGWVNADFHGMWTCCVEQGNYGHRARKATWLLVNKADPPRLNWKPCEGEKARLADGYHSAAERARGKKSGVIERLSKRERLSTPLQFRDILLDIARSVGYERRMGR